MVTDNEYVSNFNFYSDFWSQRNYFNRLRILRSWNAGLYFRFGQ